MPYKGQKKKFRHKNKLYFICIKKLVLLLKKKNNSQKLFFCLQKIVFLLKAIFLRVQLMQHFSKYFCANKMQNVPICSTEIFSRKIKIKSQLLKYLKFYVKMIFC